MADWEFCYICMEWELLKVMCCEDTCKAVRVARVTYLWKIMNELIVKCPEHYNLEINEQLRIECKNNLGE